MLTPDAVQSGWVQDETNTAITLANKGQMRLFMLDIQDCYLPILWQQRQFVSFRNHDYQHSLHNLISGLQSEVIRPQLNPQSSPSRIKVTPSKPQPVIQPKSEKSSFIHEKTGLEVVHIPAGEFLYGEDKKSIHLPEYWISKTPVTQAVYQRFIAANLEQDVPRDWDKQKRTLPNGKAEHSVIYVNWYDAIAFCKWAELQLPTEEQWGEGSLFLTIGNSTKRPSKKSPERFA